MGIDAKDTEVFQLLQKLKESNGTYPKELLAIRRQGYLKQVAEISAAAGLAAALKNTAKGGVQGTGAGVSSTVSTLLEGLLVIAIVAEAGAVSYFYRDKLVALYNNYTKSPKVEQTSNPPIIPSLVADSALKVTPGFTLTVTETPTGTAFITPSQFAGLPTDQEGVQSDAGIGSSPTHTSSITQTTNQGGGQTIATPDPNGNNGNHYGQTPMPDRTKEPGSNSTNSNIRDSSTRPTKKP
jgi:hypothetical protein